MPELPTGTVTFLFTDIEGSTSRWEQHPRFMQADSARHEAILLDSIRAHGGYAYKMVGDGFQAAFQTAPAAVAATIAAQRALAAEPWAGGVPLRVRMALHSGVVEERGDDYVGPLLNRLARLLAAGYGGQILLTSVTKELSRDRLPGGAFLRDLGTHQLKDLIQPERIFQVVASGLHADFPALKTLDTHPNNLIAQPNALIGRESEIVAVSSLLRRGDVRIVTLSGPGGTGKTRLALQVAADLLHHFADGVWFVDLAPISDAINVGAAIADAIGIKETIEQPVTDRLKGYLRQKQALLLLDNFEQVIAAAPLLDELLKAAPHLKLLITSRIVLHLYGEQEYPVPPLALPASHQLAHLDQLARYPAVELFIQRAQAVKPDFQLTRTNAADVSEICMRLDGLPLAIELAAARIKLFAPQALLDRLRHRNGSTFQLLAAGTVARTSRQQTLRGAMEWSYNLLEPVEQMLFRRLGVFVGGFTLEAAEAVASELRIKNEELRNDHSDNDILNSQCSILDLLASLVDKSLLRQTIGLDGEPRFSMLETIRAYALEQLAASGERAATQRRHLQVFLALAEEAEPQIQGPDQAAWLDHLAHEHDNLRTALQWALDNGEAEGGLRLAAALGEFWWPRGYIREGRRWLRSILDCRLQIVDYNASDQTTISNLQSAMAKALYRAGELAYADRDVDQATMLLEQALALYRQMGDRAGMARVLRGLGNVQTQCGNAERGQAFYNESIALFREINDTWGIAWMLLEIGRAAPDLGTQEALLQESLALARAEGYKRTIATALGNLGKLAHAKGEYARATEFLEETLAIGRELRDHWLTTWSLTLLAIVACHQDNASRAVALFTECLALHQASEHKEGIFDMLNYLGDMARWQGDDSRAEAFYRDSLTLLEEFGGEEHSALVLRNLGYVAIAQKHSSKALALFSESLTLFQKLRRLSGIADCLVGLARVAVEFGQPERAARLLGLAETMRADLTTQPEFITPCNREVYESLLAILPALLGTMLFEAARAAGHALSLDQGIVYALGDDMLEASIN
jgi:predicted ATPase/class 3 adenylate cyclase/tetratricopeptide (TPR) repeat protein